MTKDRLKHLKFAATVARLVGYAESADPETLTITGVVNVGPNDNKVPMVTVPLHWFEGLQREAQTVQKEIDELFGRETRP